MKRIHSNDLGRVVLAFLFFLAPLFGLLNSAHAASAIFTINLSNSVSTLTTVSFSIESNIFTTLYWQAIPTVAPTTEPTGHCVGSQSVYLHATDPTSLDAGMMTLNAGSNSFTVDGLSPKTGYTICFTAANDGPNSTSLSAVQWASVTTAALPGELLVLDNLSHTGSTDTTASFTVESNLPGTGYWRMITTGTCGSSLSVYISGKNASNPSEAGNMPINAGKNSFTVGGLSPNTNYMFCFVAGAGDETDSTLSDVLQITVSTKSSPGLSPRPPIVVGKLENTARTETTASFSVDVNVSGTGYWKVTTEGACGGNLMTYISARNDNHTVPLNAGSNSFTVDGISPNTSYTFCFTAQANSDMSPLSEELQTAIPAASTSLASIDKLIHTGSTGTTASFTVESNLPATGYWQASATGACDASSIYAAATASTPLEAGKIALTVGSNVFTADGLSPGANYTLCFVADDGGVFSDVLQAAFSTPPAASPTFCLGDPGSSPVTVPVDDVSYTITPQAENTCFEIFPTGRGRRALILVSGAGDISTTASGAPLLMARNGDLVTNTGNAKIHAMLDGRCTSTRVKRLEGNISAPEWITTPQPEGACPSDALTPEQSTYIVSDGELVCAPGSLSFKGIWKNLTVRSKLKLAGGQQYFAIAGNELYGWYQNDGAGWVALLGTFLPLATAAQTGQTATTLVDPLDISGITGIEFYIGIGTDPEEMLLNKRYCGAFKVAP
ncbi:MAG: fibronectin type III domain-containing protein [Betaproteobacteria bacterium]|nr:fibronectin type III domain-containing protein [Betaproteobacteria bacterium]